MIKDFVLNNPPHPGKIIKELCLDPLGITITRAAEALGVSRKTLSAILNGRASITPEMAIRLSIAFNTTAESWLNQQAQYDLWVARQSEWMPTTWSFAGSKTHFAAQSRDIGATE